MTETVCGRCKERLTVPWGCLHVDITQENAQFIDPALRGELQERLSRIATTPLCFEHTIEALALVEEYLGIA